MTFYVFGLWPVIIVHIIYGFVIFTSLKGFFGLFSF